jgi:hypothetical protein
MAYSLRTTQAQQASVVERSRIVIRLKEPVLMVPATLVASNV